MNISSEDVMKFLIFIFTSFAAMSKLYMSELKEKQKSDQTRIENLEKTVADLREENRQLHFKLLEEVKGMIAK